METIDDVRREEGNPRAAQPVGGKPRSIFSAFPSSGSRLLAIFLLMLGIVLLTAGAMLFIAPLALVGVVVISLAGGAYAWAKPPFERSAF
jgi:hypothetical protein